MTDGSSLHFVTDSLNATADVLACVRPHSFTVPHWREILAAMAQKDQNALKRLITGTPIPGTKAEIDHGAYAVNYSARREDGQAVEFSIYPARGMTAHRFALIFRNFGVEVVGMMCSRIAFDNAKPTHRVVLNGKRMSAALAIIRTATRTLEDGPEETPEKGAKS